METLDAVIFACQVEIRGVQTLTLVHSVQCKDTFSIG